MVFYRPCVYEVDVLILEHAYARELAREFVARVAPAGRVIVGPDHVGRAEVVDVDGEEVEQVTIAGTRETGRADPAQVVRMIADLDVLKVRPRVQRVQ